MSDEDVAVVPGRPPRPRKWEVESARRARHRAFPRRIQAQLDRLDEEAREVGPLDAVVLLRTGVVGRLRTRATGLLPARWLGGTNSHWRTVRVRRLGGWVHIQSPDASLDAYGLIVESYPHIGGARMGRRR